ncbi:MAG: sulfite exporter TauE/SafE family protein [Synechococcales bacterium]|nr:sulfite exporter TauE/SafE family protein [Synechococcales bacterium]
MPDSPLDLGLLFLTGIFTGVLSGVLGIGGGVLLVPALTLFGASTVQATATSLVGVFLSAASGSLQNLRTRQLNWRVALTLGAFGILTAQLGAWVGDRIPDMALSLGFAALLLVTIYLMNLRKRLKKQQSGQEEDRGDRSPADSEPDQHPYRFKPIAGIGLLAGVLSGLFGVGGGVVMVPLQVLFLQEPIKVAVRTSLGAIVAIAISGIVQHTLNNNVLWLPGLCIGVGGLLGAQVGTRLLPKLSDRTVNLLFKLLLIALAVYMVIRAV